MSYTYIFSPAVGHDTSTYYTQIIRLSDGYFWDNTAKGMSATSKTMTLTELNSSGSYGWECPFFLPIGYTYKIVFRRRKGASPANTDYIFDSKLFTRTKGGVVTFI